MTPGSRGEPQGDRNEEGTRQRPGECQQGSHAGEGRAKDQAPEEREGRVPKVLMGKYEPWGRLWAVLRETGAEGLRPVGH